MNQNNDPIRKAFEKWAITKTQWYDLRRFSADVPRCNLPGEYHDHHIEIAWRAWQEAWRQAEQATKEGKP